MDIQKTESQRDKLNRLFKEYGLLTEDVHKHQHYTIIRRTGIEKIAAAMSIRLTYEVCAAQPDYAAVKCIGKKPMGTKFVSIETFGSACQATSQNKYYLEMAEKRAKSRAVLQLADLYQEGVYGEDEADDFARNRNPEPRAEAPAPMQAVPAKPQAEAAPLVSATNTVSEAPAASTDPVEPLRNKVLHLLTDGSIMPHERTLRLRSLNGLNAEQAQQLIASLEKTIAERKDPKVALEHARRHLREYATKKAAELGEGEHKRLMLRAQSLTATPAELSAEIVQAMDWLEQGVAA